MREEQEKNEENMIPKPEWKGGEDDRMQECNRLDSQHLILPPPSLNGVETAAQEEELILRLRLRRFPLLNRLRRIMKHKGKSSPSLLCSFS